MNSLKMWVKVERINKLMINFHDFKSWEKNMNSMLRLNSRFQWLGEVLNFLVRNKATLKCTVWFKTSRIYELKFWPFKQRDYRKTEGFFNILHSKLKLFDFLHKIYKNHTVDNFKIKNPNITKNEFSGFLNCFTSNNDKEFFNELKAYIGFV